MWAPVSAGGRGLLSLRGPLGQAWSRAPPAGHSGTAGGHAGGRVPMHRATTASFQAPPEAYELWKRLTETEPNTRLPQKYLKTMIGAHKTQNEMCTRLQPHPAKLTQPSSSGRDRRLVQPPWKQCGGSSGSYKRPGTSRCTALAHPEDTDAWDSGTPAPQCPQQPGPQ